MTLSGSKIIDVQALQLPNDRQYSAEISDYVAPYLRQMALQAQSANIDIISGATYTSDGLRPVAPVRARQRTDAVSSAGR